MNQMTALLVTLAIEVPVVLAVAWGSRRRPMAPCPADDERPRTLAELAVVALAATLVTHPFAWGFNVALADMWAFAPRAALIETLVVLAEWGVLAKFGRLGVKTALLASALANATSFGAGLVWFYFLR